MESFSDVRQLLDFKIPFEEEGQISEEDLERTRNKAILYHGLDRDLTEGFLIHAQELSREIQESLQREIEERSQVFIAQVNGHLQKSLSDQEEYAVAQMVRCQLAHFPDDQELEEVLFAMAESMGRFFAAYGQAD